MSITNAEKISLKSFLNAFFKELHDTVQFAHASDRTRVIFELQSENITLEIPLKYYSMVGRHQYDFDALTIAPLTLVARLIKELAHRYPKAPQALEFLQRFKNSADNIAEILQHLPENIIQRLFSENVDFELSENCLIAGHSLHPAPKSREGFSKNDFKKYSPELRQKFQLHYFLADKDIVATESAIKSTAHEISTQYLFHEKIPVDKILIPLHPWQAKYLSHHPVIQRYFQNGQLQDLGVNGEYFSATSSVRTVYSPACPYMLKFSLNVAVTNSVRMQYAKELYRGVAAHRFWASSVGLSISKKYPTFSPLTDPAFICLRDGDKFLDETAVLFRTNPFQEHNVTSIASLCQDHPFQNKNRFTTIIDSLATSQKITFKAASILWFETFLHVAIEPLLWIYCEYGIGLEAHQQNLLVELENNLPVKSYYRDNQGYYINDEAITGLSQQISPDILLAFCQGSHEFIAHHLIYYIIGNSVFGVINALGTTGYVEEEALMIVLADFINDLAKQWHVKYPLLQKILQSKTLPFKANLLTRFYELDELTAPLEAQSVYIEIENYLQHTDLPVVPDCAGMINITNASWNKANRQLVAKILSEFLYEEMLNTDIVDDQHYLRISNDLFYTFKAAPRIFGNFRIDVKSITRHEKGNTTKDIFVNQFIRDTYQMIGIDGLTLGHLLRELNHTLLADCHLYAFKNVASEHLLQLNNHELESHMTGHPWFVINKGRLGFSYSDYGAYAPEMAKPAALSWIAVHHAMAIFHASKKLNYDLLIQEELSKKDFQKFANILIDLKLPVTDYYFMPVHDWQWNMQIISLFAQEIVHHRIVYLGKSADLYLPTQSIRTFCNVSNTKKLQVKLPLSIFNTAVFRGLPGERTRAAPMLSDWLFKKMQQDSFLQKECRLILLGEIASIDVPHRDYNDLHDVPYQYKELLGVIWRENVNHYLQSHEKAITMAALIHVDQHEKPFISTVIAKSGLTMDAWLQCLFQAVIPPLLHWLYQYGLVFSPHGENTLLILDNFKPVGLVLKDFIDDVNISESPIPERADLSKELQDILLSVPDDAITQFIYTGLFVVLYRYLSDILQTYENYSEKDFWQKVHAVILDYQNKHPLLKERFKQFDLCKQYFNKMCLNRLRLLSVGYKDYADRPKVDTIRPMQNPLRKYAGE